MHAFHLPGELADLHDLVFDFLFDFLSWYFVIPLVRTLIARMLWSLSGARQLHLLGQLLEEAGGRKCGLAGSHGQRPVVG